jgi:hypothetical protein
MQTIQLADVRQEVKDFLAMPDGIKKNIVYNRSFSGNHASKANILIKDDGTIHYSHNTYKLSKGVKYFLKPNSKSGFTVEPNGRMRLWFNAKLQTIPFIDEVLKHLKREWVQSCYLQYITPSLLGKIIVGKITNPHDLCKAILKMYRVQGSPALLSKCITANTFFNKSTLLLGIKTAKNLDHFFEYLQDNSLDHTYSDLCQQAIILERKVDFKWSQKRMTEEHKMWTREIMDIEADSLSTDKLQWLDKLRTHTPEGFTLIDSEREMYAEGKTMSHCVFTNYWSSVRHEMYVVYNITYSGGTYTLGLNYDQKELKFNQLYGPHNTQAPAELHEYVKRWLYNTNKQLLKTKFQEHEELLHFS